MSYQRILILSSQFGGGHYYAGQALAEELQMLESAGTEVRHLDFGSFFFRKTDYIMRKAYLSFVKKIPEVYGKLFDRTVDITGADCSKLIQLFLSRSFLDYIEEYNPDVIVNTHFLSAGILGECKRRGMLHTPLVTVVTDFHIHGIWLHPGVDLFIVGCRESYERLIAGGINPERIAISGIPVRSGFRNMLSKKLAREMLGLNTERQTILIMGGAEGFSVSADEIMEILSSPRDVQFLLVCGKDREIFDILSGRIQGINNKVLIYGYVDNVHELMAASDLLITKGGGLTISEALTVGLPLIMFKPIPGHEDGNAMFVAGSGAGIVVQRVEDLIKIMEELLEDPSKREDMSRSAKEVLPDNSTGKVVKSIIRQAHLSRVKRYDYQDGRVVIV